jgi:hypothetical protein
LGGLSGPRNPPPRGHEDERNDGADDREGHGEGDRNTGIPGVSDRTAGKLSQPSV